ncbi:Methylmalonyl-CoA mutase [Fibrisoma limi BUZ 3]|uniref:Methylmalonyl-CoA mutase n=1 Tax=Fibrisoma limi BUZ 3 TaxID=1185876 RepID=I2GTR7_9BACT|nr:methylmalonyl-CoA mutase family protein [Fibrisoma limi]CCH57297.1 Methylmalonyl-CoA mutase [Fibrisoma limi BUZ 3]
MFAEHFSTTDKQQWIEQVRKDLKDPAAYETLRWSTPEGFTLEPYYTADDLATLPLNDIQGAQKQVPGWLNAPERAVSDEKMDNSGLRDAISRGADALVLSWSTTKGSATSDRVTSGLARLLNGVKLSDTPVFFRLNGDVAEFMTALRTVAPYQLKGGLLVDPLASWATSGQPYADELKATVAATRQTADSPQFRTVTASSHAFHNAGATATQELAFLLASLADQYDGLTNAGLTIDAVFPKTLLSVSVGTSYFVEIAKLRALRVLWQRFSAAYGQFLAPCPLLHVQTSTFYDAVATPYTNLLRATTEAMAAVTGGCDVLTVHPYDTVFEAPSEFSERIARNVSVLLKEEAYLDKVADPSAGSYYVEILTYQLVEAAWALFLNVEERGGFVDAFEQGFVQSEIERSYQAKVEAVRSGKVLVGVTKFRHDENPVVSSPHKPGNSLSQPADAALLPDRRLAQAFE